jgi:hypothetical protein
LWRKWNRPVEFHGNLFNGREKIKDMRFFGDHLLT